MNGLIFYLLCVVGGAVAGWDCHRADGVESSWDIRDLQSKDLIHFGLLAFHNAGYAAWQTIYGSTGVA